MDTKKYIVKVKVSIEVEAPDVDTAEKEALGKVAGLDIDDITIVDKASGYVVKQKNG